MWPCLNSSNTNNCIAISAISIDNSTFGDNYRYLSYRYNMGFYIWILALNSVLSLYMYMSNQDNSLYSAHGTIIRDLCLAELKTQKFIQHNT